MPEDTLVINIVPFEPKWIESPETAYCIRITMPDGVLPNEQSQEQCAWSEIERNKWCAGDYHSLEEADTALRRLTKQMGIKNREAR
jgi:hypothetical protein